MNLLLSSQLFDLLLEAVDLVAGNVTVAAARRQYHLKPGVRSRSYREFGVAGRSSANGHCGRARRETNRKCCPRPSGTVTAASLHCIRIVRMRIVGGAARGRLRIPFLGTAVAPAVSERPIAKAPPAPAPYLSVWKTHSLRSRFESGTAVSLLLSLARRGPSAAGPIANGSEKVSDEDRAVAGCSAVGTLSRVLGSEVGERSAVFVMAALGVVMMMLLLGGWWWWWWL